MRSFAVNGQLLKREYNIHTAENGVTDLDNEDDVVSDHP